MSELQSVEADKSSTNAAAGNGCRGPGREHISCHVKHLSPLVYWNSIKHPSRSCCCGTRHEELISSCLIQWDEGQCLSPQVDEVCWSALGTLLHCSRIRSRRIWRSPAGRGAHSTCRNQTGIRGPCHISVLSWMQTGYPSAGLRKHRLQLWHPSTGLRDAGCSYDIPALGWGSTDCSYDIPALGWGSAGCSYDIPALGWGSTDCSYDIPALGWGSAGCSYDIPALGWGSAGCSYDIPALGWGSTGCSYDIPALGWGSTNFLRPSVWPNLQYKMQPEFWLLSVNCWQSVK